MNKEIEEMTDGELIEFINLNNKRVIEEVTRDNKIFKQLKLAKLELQKGTLVTRIVTNACRSDLYTTEFKPITTNIIV